MGMLFNTDATLRLLSLTNTAFNKANYTNNILGNSSIRAVFTPPYTNIDTFTNLAKKLGIDHEETGKSARWKNWLNYFDTDVASVVYGYIYTHAIQNANVIQVEFFAVPSATGNLTASYALVVDQQTQGSDGSKYTLAISISTNTIDQLTSLRPHLRGRPPRRDGHQEER